MLRKSNAGIARSFSKPSRPKIEFFKSSLLEWWNSGKRHFPWRNPSASRYQQIVSEVLLQRTQATTVARFWPGFMKRFPSWQALSDATVDEIESALRPIGLSQQRAPRLHALAVIAARQKGRFPHSRNELENLPGVGQYIASSVLMFSHGQCQPLLDVNMARVVERFFGPRTLADIRYDPYLQQLCLRIVTGPKPQTVNWAILDFAALVCKPKPRCESCPLQARCYFARNNIRYGEEDV